MSGTILFVSALTALGNGDVIAAGIFANAGGAVANNIARWDGTNWSQLAAAIARSTRSRIRCTS